jgi:hypothetical protein
MPHFVRWYESGSAVWIADNDDILYLTLAANAYHNHPLHLADPLKKEGGDSIFPGMQLLPAVVVARAAKLGPFAIGLLLRLWAGIAVPLTLYLLIRQFVNWPWIAAGLTLALLFDAGLIFAHLLLRPLLIAFRVITSDGGAYLSGFPQIQWHWRIATPSVIIPAVFLFLLFQTRARVNPTVIRIMLASLAFGSLFYLYFYFWTAAGLGLLLSFLIDAGYRRTHLLIGLIGLSLGLPALIGNYLITQRNPPDWRARTDYFLPISHLSEFLLPKLALLLLVGCFIWIWRRRRDLLPFWSLAAAGILLANHQLITGFQIQNFHWSFIWGPILALTVGLLLISFVKPAKPRPWIVVGFAAYCVVTVGLGFWLRFVEVTRTSESINRTAKFDLYRNSPTNISFPPRSVIAGDRDFVNIAVIMENVRPLRHYAMDVAPGVSDSEWDARIALDSYLLGIDAEEFERRQREFLGGYGYGPIARDRTLLDARLRRQIAAYDEVVRDPTAAVKRFEVRYVVLPRATSPPNYLGAGGWEPVGGNEIWQVWQNVGD